MVNTLKEVKEDEERKRRRRRRSTVEDESGDGGIGLEHRCHEVRSNILNVVS